MSRRRRLAVILGALVAGAAINVVVAWGCACGLFPSALHMTGMPNGESPPQWPIENKFGRPRPDFWVRSQRVGLSEIAVHHQHANTDPDNTPWFISVSRFGLPMRSMLIERVYTQNGTTDPRVPAGPYNVGMRVTWHGEDIDLPLRPVWPGFAVNTAVNATGLLLIGAIPGRVRCCRRRRRGACLACGYASGGIAVCPECGTGAARSP